MANGTSQDEVAKITRMIHDHKNSMDARVLATLREMLSGLNKHASELETIRRQIKNK